MRKIEFWPQRQGSWISSLAITRSMNMDLAFFDLLSTVGMLSQNVLLFLRTARMKVIFVLFDCASTVGEGFLLYNGSRQKRILSTRPLYIFYMLPNAHAHAKRDPIILYKVEPVSS